MRYTFEAYQYISVHQPCARGLGGDASGNACSPSAQLSSAVPSPTQLCSTQQGLGFCRLSSHMCQIPPSMSTSGERFSQCCE
jgi:hypothetical protein